MTGSYPVDVFADLILEVDGRTVEVHGTGPRVVVDLPDARAGAALMRSGPFRTRRLESLTRLDRLLRTAGLTVDVLLDGTLLARLGDGARAGALGRLLRLGSVEVRPARSFGSLVRRRPGTAAAVAGLAGLTAAFWLRRRS